MRKETFELVKKDSLYLGIIFLVLAIALKIAFFNENMFVILRAALSLFWLFALPGYAITLYWQEKLAFIERLVIGIALSAGIMGIASYYIGLLGLNIKYHVVLLPLIMVLVGAIINLRK